MVSADRGGGPFTLWLCVLATVLPLTARRYYVKNLPEDPTLFVRGVDSIIVKRFFNTFSERRARWTSLSTGSHSTRAR